MQVLTRRQTEIYNYLRDNADSFACAPSLDELCEHLGMASRGSLYKHIIALINAGLVEPFAGNKQAGVRLTVQDEVEMLDGLPFIGSIAAGKPIEALATIEYMSVPDALKTNKPCYVLQVKGDSMIDAGIYDGDWVVIEQRHYARNGEIVVALIDNTEATLKYIDQQSSEKIMLVPANVSMSAFTYHPRQVQIQGVLVGQMRSYR